QRSRNDEIDACCNSSRGSSQAGELPDSARMEESSGVLPHMSAREVAGLRTKGRSEIRSTISRTARKLSGRPCAAGTPADGHLAGLLTYASLKDERLPGSLQWHAAHRSRRIQLRGSGGFSPRFPNNQMERSYMRRRTRSSNKVPPKM